MYVENMMYGSPSLL